VYQDRVKKTSREKVTISCSTASGNPFVKGESNHFYPTKNMKGNKYEKNEEPSSDTDRKSLAPHRGTNMKSLDELFLQRPAEFSEGMGNEPKT
jgi:hypothetical protein